MPGLSVPAYIGEGLLHRPIQDHAGLRLQQALRNVRHDVDFRYRMKAPRERLNGGLQSQVLKDTRPQIARASRQLLPDPVQKALHRIQIPTLAGGQLAVGPVQRQARRRHQLHGFVEHHSRHPGDLILQLPFWYRKAVFDRRNSRRLASKGAMLSAKKVLAAVIVWAISLAVSDCSDRHSPTDSWWIADHSGRPRPPSNAPRPSSPALRSSIWPGCRT